MKTSKQILSMSERDLRRLVARQQAVIAEHELDWSRGGAEPGTWHTYEKALADARRIKREVYQS